MKPSEAIKKLEGKRFDLESLAAIGALVDIAYDFLKDATRGEGLDNEGWAQLQALEKVFPYLRSCAVSERETDGPPGEGDQGNGAGSQGSRQPSRPNYWHAPKEGE